jgi:hypothetical protein
MYIVCDKVIKEDDVVFVKMRYPKRRGLLSFSGRVEVEYVSIIFVIK